VTKKAEDIIDASRAYSNKRDEKNECNGGQKLPVRARRQRRRNEKKLLYNGCRQEEELL